MTIVRLAISVAITGFLSIAGMSSAWAAITIVGTNQADAKIDGANMTLTFDGTPVQNDLIILSGGYYGGSSPPGPADAGYTELILVGSGASIRFGIWYKFMGASPDSSVTGLGSGEPGAGAYQSIVLRGVDLTTPFDATVQQASGSSSRPDGASITTVTTNAMVLPVALANNVDDVIGIPTGYTGLGTPGCGACSAASANQPSSSVDATIGAAYLIKATAGAEDPGEWASWTTVGNWVVFTLAIRPASGGPPPSCAPTLPLLGVGC